jgi:hypothetical protein
VNDRTDIATVELLLGGGCFVIAHQCDVSEGDALQGRGATEPSIIEEHGYLRWATVGRPEPVRPFGYDVVEQVQLGGRADIGGGDRLGIAARTGGRAARETVSSRNLMRRCCGASARASRAAAVQVCSRLYRRASAEQIPTCS